MPLKRVARRQPRRRLVSSAEVLAALEEGLDRIPEPTPKERRRAEKGDARFARWQAEGHALWDAMTATERAEAGAEILRGIRRYDSEADERDLGGDGGRGIFAIHHACDRDAARQARRTAKRPKADPYTGHRRAYAPAKAVAAQAVRPAPAIAGARATDEPTEAEKPRRKRPAGVVGYLDPRLIDDDEWED